MKKLDKQQIASLKDKVVAKSPKNEVIDKVTKAAVSNKVIKGKDSTYLYPEGCDDLGARKNHRSKVRKQLKNLERDLNLATKGKIDKDPSQIEKAISLFKKDNYYSK